MNYMNDIVCEKALNGWCDQLGKNPKNYLFTFVLTIVFNYGIPLLTIIAITIFWGQLYIKSNFLDLFSSILPAISTMFMLNATIGLLVAGMVILILDLLYIVYMIRQIGVYVTIPILAEIAKWIILFWFKEWFVISIVLSLIPFMTFAVAVHFITYTFNKGFLTRK